MMNFVVPQSGDDLFTSGKEIEHELIKWFSRSPGEAPTKATHQGKFFDSKDVVQARMEKKKVVFDVWLNERMRLKTENIEYCIIRKKRPLTHNETCILQVILSDMRGWKYSKGELVLCAMDGLLSRWLGRDMLFFRRVDIFRERVICSKTANRPDVKMGYLPEEALYWTPDDTYDFKTSGNDYELVEASIGWMDA